MEALIRVSVESVVSDLSTKNYPWIVVVKSTLSPRTMDTLHSSYSDLRLCYMPEYLREKDALEWFANPDRIVISGDRNDIEVVLESFSGLMKMFLGLRCRT